jgi:hypothetical protein
MCKDQMHVAALRTDYRTHRNLGPDLAVALVDTGFHVTVLNRGVTQPSSLPAGIERLYADSSDKPTLAAAVGARKFDAVVDTTLAACDAT